MTEIYPWQSLTMSGDNVPIFHSWFTLLTEQSCLCPTADGTFLHRNYTNIEWLQINARESAVCWDASEMWWSQVSCKRYHKIIISYLCLVKYIMIFFHNLWSLDLLIVATVYKHDCGDDKFWCIIFSSFSILTTCIIINLLHHIVYSVIITRCPMYRTVNDHFPDSHIVQEVGTIANENIITQAWYNK